LFLDPYSNACASLLRTVGSHGVELLLKRFSYQDLDPPTQPVPPAIYFLLDCAGGGTIPFFFDAQIGISEAVWGERRFRTVQRNVLSSLTISLAVGNSASGMAKLPARSHARGRNARFSYSESLIFTVYAANRHLQFERATFPLRGKGANQVDKLIRRSL
jgi:hypothetical protein